MGVSGRRRLWNCCWLLISCIPDVLFPNVFIVEEQGSFTSSFSRQWLFLSKFFCVWKHLQRFWLWDWIIIMRLNWTAVKPIAVWSQGIWNTCSSLLNICNCKFYVYCIYNCNCKLYVRCIFLQQKRCELKSLKECLKSVASTWLQSQPFTTFFSFIFRWNVL